MLGTLVSFACNSDQNAGAVSPESASEFARPGIARPENSRPEPPAAQWNLVELLREGAASPLHPSDGAGRAWLEPVDGAIRGVKG